ncbi:MAG: PLP-dependent aminotransferase family protein [Clostridia bacterium]|nr:PLP-dependent aminotransferase family protein [Clostridia bacterium]
MNYNFSDKIKSLKPSAIREMFKSLVDPEVISFAAGNPAPESFPVEELARLSADIYANSAVSALQYSMTEGYAPLRAAVTERQKAKFGVVRDNDDTLIVSGGNQGIELAAKIFTNEGDVVVCEEPTFIGALNAFRSCGARTVGVKLHDDGIDPEELDKTLAATPNAKMIYLIPTFHNPCGTSTSLEKRKAILAVAKKHGVVIFEDNPYGELRFEGEDIPTIKSLDEDGIVIYCSSFSKILSAGMRVGFVIADKEIISKMTVAKQSEDVHTNIFFQMLCHKYMTECDLDAHIEKIRGIYKHKTGLMLSCLDKNMPDCITYTRPQGGLFIWCRLPEGVEDCSDYIKACMANKVAVVPGSTFNCDPSKPSSGFRLNYSTPSDEQIVLGVERISKAARDMFCR